MLKAAMSIDGYIDDPSPERRVFSNELDKQKVEELRAGFDAILVGAGTLRADNPRLAIRSGKMRRRRQQLGLSPDITKITLSRSGNLSPELEFFKSRKADKLVYAPQDKADELARQLYGLATVIPCSGNEVSLAFLLGNLYSKGIRRLLVEGGGSILTAFLRSGFVSELRIAVAPVFIGNPKAPQLVTHIISQDLPTVSHGPLMLKAVEQLGEMSILSYSIT